MLLEILMKICKRVRKAMQDLENLAQEIRIEVTDKKTAQNRQETVLGNKATGINSVAFVFIDL